MKSVIQASCALSLVILIAGASPAAEKPKTKTTSGKVEVLITGWPGVQKLVKAQKGKVVVIDIWTTTCTTCLKKFPQFTALGKKFGKRVALISVNCDYDGVKGKPPEFYKQGVLTFLRKQHATCQNVMLNISFLKYLELVNLESSPAIFVYDKRGKLAKRFDNDGVEKESEEFTMKQVHALISKLVKDRSE